MTFSASLPEIVKHNRSGLLVKHPSWERVALRDVARVLNGFPFESGRFNLKTGTPLLRIRDILRNHTDTYYDGVYDPSFLVTMGELVVGMDGDFNCSLWRGPDALLNQRVCKVTPDDEYYDRLFLAYVLPGYLTAINEATSSITVKHLSSFTVQDVPLPLPPRHEQRRIVAAIEQQFTRLEAGVAALKRAQARLKRYRASVLKAAVEGELTAEWRAAHPATETGAELLRRILVERRARWEADLRAKGKDPAKARYAEPAGPVVTGLPKVPGDWCWATVEQVVSRSEYGTSVKCSYEAHGLPVLRIPNIAKGEIDLSDVKYATQPLAVSDSDSLRLGDILMCRTNGSVSLIGKTATVRNEFDKTHTFASYLLRFRLIEERILPMWLHLFVSSPQGRAFIEGNAASSAGQHNISLSLMHGMSFPLPPLAEQEEVIAEIERRLSVVTALEATVEANLKRSERLRQSILREAFAGRLVPQDPSDEPADALLERIREEWKTSIPRSRRGRVTPQQLSLLAASE